MAGRKVKMTTRLYRYEGGLLVLNDIINGKKISNYKYH